MGKRKKFCKRGHLLAITRRISTGGTHYCYACLKLRDILYREKYRDKYLLKYRKINLKKNYGISLEEYNGMLEKQNKTCAICNTDNNRKKNFYVDHCHKTGKIRGLLCHNCNFLLGHSLDNINILKSAINYLKKHE